MTTDWSDDLLSDRSILKLYLNSYRKSKYNFNIIASILFFQFFFILSAINFYLPNRIFSFDKIQSILISELNMSISYTSSILGFLVSGFSLFFAIMSKEQIYFLTKNREENSDISSMKTIMYCFMSVFINYLILLILSSVIYFIIQDGGSVSNFVEYLIKNYPSETKMSSILVLSSLTSLIIYNILLLKSFIWNIYQTILISISVNIEEMDRNPSNES